MNEPRGPQEVFRLLGYDRLFNNCTGNVGIDILESDIQILLGEVDCTEEEIVAALKLCLEERLHILQFNVGLGMEVVKRPRFQEATAQEKTKVIGCLEALEDGLQAYLAYLKTHE